MHTPHPETLPLHPGRAGLVIGITGHRDIDPADEGPLRAAFAGVLARYGSAYPHTPLIVLSSLAEGADMLAAEEAIALGVPVIACLTETPEQLRSDLSAGPAARVDALLALCTRIHVVASRSDGDLRYLDAGLYIAHNSHMVVAFWDGTTAKGIGGTADVVTLRTKGIIDADEAGDKPYLADIGPIVHIVTPRLGESLANAREIIEIYPKRFSKDTNARRDFERSLDDLDRYNADLARLPAPTAPQTGDGIARLLCRTDQAANRLQRESRGYLIALYACAFLALLTQTVSGDPTFRFLTLLAASIVFVLARRSDVENRYQDYRALAEGLRVQSAWLAAGIIGERVEQCYLRMQESELQWIRMALRYVYVVYVDPTSGQANGLDLKACRQWIREQWRYFYRAARADAARARRLTLVTQIIFALACVATLAGFALPLPFVSHALGIGAPISKQYLWLLDHLATVPLTMALALAFLLGNYSEKRGFQANIKRYERMFVVFDNARRRIDRFARRENLDVTQALVRDLGEAALVEHADWLLARRERPMSFVGATALAPPTLWSFDALVQRMRTSSRRRRTTVSASRKSETREPADARQADL